MNSVRLNNLSLKRQRFTLLGYKDLGIIKFEFVANSQFLLKTADLMLLFRKARLTVCFAHIFDFNF